MTGVDLPNVIIQYIAGRDAYRAKAVAELISGLTERELLLVKEAAVMGWVQGMRHHDLPCPPDRKILTTVIDACLAFADLYPTITGHTPDTD